MREMVNYLFIYLLKVRADRPVGNNRNATITSTINKLQLFIICTKK